MEVANYLEYCHVSCTNDLLPKLPNFMLCKVETSKFMNKIDLFTKLDSSDSKGTFWCKVNFIGVKEFANKEKRKIQKVFRHERALHAGGLQDVQPDDKRSVNLALHLCLKDFAKKSGEKKKQNTPDGPAVNTQITGKQKLVLNMHLHMNNY